MECIGQARNYCAQKKIWCCGMQSFGRGIVSARPDPELIESDFFDRNEGMKTVSLEVMHTLYHPVGVYLRLYQTQ